MEIERGTFRAVAFVLGILVLLEVAWYPALADWIGKHVLGNGGGPEYGVLGFQLIYVLPAGLLFVVGATAALLRAADASARTFWRAIIIIIIVNLLLLTLSVALYFHLARG